MVFYECIVTTKNTARTCRVVSCHVTVTVEGLVLTRKRTVRAAHARLSLSQGYRILGLSQGYRILDSYMPLWNKVDVAIASSRYESHWTLLSLI
jgi:hypothetical protein